MDKAEQAQNRLVTLCLEGSFPTKLGNTLTYQKLKTFTHGLLVGADRLNAYLLLDPLDTALTAVRFPPDIVAAEIRPMPRDRALEWLPLELVDNQTQLRIEDAD